MQKILKLSAVSVLAVITASGANAAGYTCEELIEYTSCNAGYTLSAHRCVDMPTCSAGSYSTQSCPDGYTYSSDWCWEGDYWYSISEDNDCTGESYGMGCRIDKEDEDGGEVSYEITDLIPVEYTCASCPDTGLVSPNNTPILATSNAGATSAADCYVPSGVDIKGENGIYRFKSNCEIDWWVVGFQDESDCDKLAASDTADAMWMNSDEGDYCITSSNVTSLLNQEECLAKYGTEWTADGLCRCEYDGYCGYWMFGKSGLSCEAGC